MKKSTIIYFHPEAYTTSGPRLMGRNAAGFSFLKGYAKHNAANFLRIFTDDSSYDDIFIEMMKTLGINDSIEFIHEIDSQTVSDSIIFFPGPTLEEPAWQRYSLGPNRYSLCGITHTTASASVMDSVGSWPEAPLYEWDAVICTSRVVRDTLTCILEEQKKYLKARYQVDINFPLPQLPIIPLGINAKEFFFSNEQKNLARQNLGIMSDDVVILFSGRLSFHAKAHPLAMYQSIQELAKNFRIVLIECGWFANEHIEEAYIEAFSQVCPGVRRIVLDGRLEDSRQQAWASADIFCSLSDNIQETFGLTPLEAMASGIPVVVSDWNGYKDTVRDGIDGFRIPTFQPNRGLGDTLARKYELGVIDYDRYCGLTSQLVAVDIGATIFALEQLIKNKELRRSFGESGRLRVSEMFDWKVVIPQYESLWNELDLRRQFFLESCKPHTQEILVRPSRLDPFTLFENYPTKSVNSLTTLSLALKEKLSIEEMMAKFNKLSQLKMIAFGNEVQLSSENSQVIFKFLANGPKTVSEICSLATPNSRRQLQRNLVWLIKLGFLTVV